MYTISITEEIKERTKLNFQFYINVSTLCYSTREKSHRMCFNIDLNSVLINNKTFKKFYLHIFTYIMTNNKRLQCRKVEESVISFECARISIKLKNDRD